MNIIMQNITEYRNQLSKYEALESFINTENTIIDGKNNFIKKDGTIEFRDVDFSYNENRDIFKNFNLKITWWQKIAIIWKTGSGKSTFIQLLLRNYDTTKWSIYIDEQNIRDIKIASLYTNIGYLPQDPAVSDGTIRENLEYAQQEIISDDRIWGILKKVELDELIRQSKNGLETEVGERGIRLSGWERQRLAIARIILKNPEILILDEATSALDTETERLIQDSLEKLMEGRTSIIIAHRLSTIQHVDRIYMLDDGEVIASGSHAELMQTSEKYRHLIELQHDGFVGDVV
jgi:ABC-type multidrug transport system fused ATPase/permease subunit